VLASVVQGDADACNTAPIEKSESCWSWLRHSQSTFSESNSSADPKIFKLDPGPGIFQIWDSDSCSDYGYYRSNWN